MVDPLGGSYYVEALTASLAAEAWKLIQEVEALGGMTKAVESGMPKLRIEEAAARRQAAIDRGEEVIVGVNKYRSPTRFRHRGARRRQHRRARAADRPARHASRDARRATLPGRALAIEEGAAGNGNLLELSIDATRARATVGEISDALEAVFSRHRATIRSIAGVYGAAYEGDEGYAEIRAAVDDFAAREGRRPRLLVAKLGQDGHDRGAKVIATAFADLGFDVDVGPLFQTPEEAARDAVENDVHVVGVSSQAAGHKTLVPELIAQLRKQGGDDILVVVGGVIPAQDYDELREAGVAAIFGPGTNIPKAAAEIVAPRRLPTPDRPRRQRRSESGRNASRSGSMSELARQVIDGDRRALARDHAGRVDARRSPRRRRGVARGAVAALGERATGRDLRRARGGQVDVHRSARPLPRRAGPSRRGARGRPVERAKWWIDPRRQDAHGTAHAIRRRVRSAVADRRHARRCRAAHAKRCCCARAQVSTSCWSRRSASVNRRRRCRAWSTCSSCSSRPAAATSSRDSSAGSWSSPTSSS